ncbi:MAG: hypothetical protein ACKPKO_13910 [Candidatus Fonsibacter sp.]
MVDIKDDFRIMMDIMGTNEDIQDMYDNHCENYITVVYLKRYELVTTYDIEPINPLTRRQRNTQQIDMCYYYYINTELDLSRKTFKESIENKALY